MGAVEYVLRVGFDQSGKDEFFPISLVVAGIGLFVALTTLSGVPPDAADDEDVLESAVRRMQEQRYQLEVYVAKVAIWMSIAGVVGWIYLLAASFNEAVRAVITHHPLGASAIYYVVGAALTEWKAREPAL
jgi:hypothetical protein